MVARRAVLMPLVAVVALVATSSATAALPRAGLIVPGRSIAGLRLGVTARAARKAWGIPAQCGTAAGVHYCRYATARPLSGFVSFVLTRGRVSSISLEAAYNPTTKRFVETGPLASFRTAKGIRIGSTAAAVRHAYPSAGSAASGQELTLTNAKRVTYFLLSSAGNVYGITLNS